MADRPQPFAAACLALVACSPRRSTKWGKAEAEPCLPALSILFHPLAPSLCLLLAMSAAAEPASTICPRCSAFPAIRAAKPAPCPLAPPHAFLRSARHWMHRRRHGYHCRQAKLHARSSPEPSSPPASPGRAARGATPLRSASPLRCLVSMQLRR
jgi:hypothetical protein